MPKEITLDELVTSNTTDVPIPQRQQRAIVKESPNNGARVMTAAQVEDSLVSAGKMQRKEEVTVDAPLVANAFKSMDATLAERRERIEKAIPYIHENAREIALDNELKQLGEDAADENDTDVMDDDLVQDEPAQENDESTDSFFIPESTVVDDEVPAHEPQPEVKIDEPTTNATTTTYTADNDDYTSELDELAKALDEETDDEFDITDTEEEDPDEARERLKDYMKDVKIINNPVNLGDFRIRKEAVSSNAVLNTLQHSRVLKRADWALYHTKRSLTFIECTGTELDSLRKTVENSNNLNGVVRTIQFVYDHIDDPNKPEFESWCKTIRTEDFESLCYGLYKACYGHSNIIGRVCESDTCGKTSLIDTDINAMVVYGGEGDDHEAVKAEFQRILQKNTTSPTPVIESKLLQVSDDIVIAYSPATLFSTFIQFHAVKPEITQKHNELLNSMAYIDGFYTINRATKELTPISIKEYPRNFNRTVLNRLTVYANILKTLTPDQYNVLMGTLANIIQPPKITYVYPKVKCPECGAEITEAPVESMLSLLFTRAQWSRIKSL